MKTLIGIVTFGGLKFTKLAIEGVRDTVKNPYELFCVVGKPDDKETLAYFEKEKIPHILHETNWGFPASINDIYDYGFKQYNYDYIVFMGNDVIPYKYAIDNLINIANETDNEWVCARQFDVKALCSNFPQVRHHFIGEDYIYVQSNEKPWELFEEYRESTEILPGGGLSDVHNLALYKKSVFDKIGYIDVNFFPAYFEDNDIARRAVNAEIKSATALDAWYFHFWSRTFKEGTGGSSHKYFRLNENFYLTKWGGEFGHEVFKRPFNGYDTSLFGVTLPGNLKIDSREDEKEIINYWRERGK